jgi:RepB plasmid partitioning protein/ParB-like nuclease domain
LSGPSKLVQQSFEHLLASIPIASIYPVRSIGITLKRSTKYRQIAASIKEVGIIEHPVVTRDRSERGRFILLDGHLRIEVLKDLGQTEVTCLVSADDESYTYNKRINRLAVVQEHLMILQAIQRGVPKERIASALNINLNTVFKKTKLLDGICPEVVDMLHDKPAATNTFTALRKMAPVRQIEAAQLMVAMNRYTVTYAQSLLAATPSEQLIAPKKRRLPTGLTPDQLDLMQRESMNLDRQFRVAERTYGEDHLDLVIVRGYVTKLIANQRVRKFLRQSYGDILSELERIAETPSETRNSSG